MSEDELARWLTDHGFAEVSSGYGHASGNEIAEALLQEFDISPKLPRGTVRGTEKY